MKNYFPQAKNSIATLQEFSIKKLTFRQVLDFGRYIIRVDPDAGEGYFESEVKIGQFAGKLHLIAGRLASFEAPGDELPPQVKIALQRAGYAV